MTVARPHMEEATCSPRCRVETLALALPTRTGALEPPLPNQKRAKGARGGHGLITRQCWLSQQVARVNARLQPVPTQAAEPVNDLDAGPHKRLGVERRLHRHKSVRLDVLPELELRRAQEGADVGLHVGRSDREPVSYTHLT